MFYSPFLNSNEATAASQLADDNMPRARKDKIKDEDVPLTIRNTSRKRKLVEYAEAESQDDDLSGSPGDTKDTEIANWKIESPQGRRKTQKPSKTKESTSTPRRGKAGGRVKEVLAEEVHTAIQDKEEENGLIEEDEHHVAVGSPAKSTPSKSNRNSKATNTQALDPDLSSSESPTKPKRKRKTKEEKEAEAMPLAARTVNLRMFVGAHTSIAKGVENSILNAHHIGANAFACFLKSQRKWDNRPLSPNNRDAFKSKLLTHSYDPTRHIVPHGSYLVNLASPDADMSAKSYSAFLDDLQRCESLGITYYNFHPGSTNGRPLHEAISRLAVNLNRALSATTTVVPLLENMASHGTIIGGRFSDLASIIAQISPEHQTRIGVCIDTCHAFAAGYDLRSPDAFAATLTDFDKTVGIKYLKALHINDSKAPWERTGISIRTLAWASSASARFTT